jgi:hypothetical protein
VGGTCGMHGGGERFLQGFIWKAQREDLGLDERIKLRRTLGR